MVLGADDGNVFLSDFAETVTIAGVSAMGIFDQPDTETADGLMIGSDFSVLGKNSDFGDADFGDAAVIRGANYTVKTVKKLDDGVFCRVYLAKD